MYYPYRLIPEEITGKDYNIIVCRKTGITDFNKLVGLIVTFSGKNYEVIAIDRIFDRYFGLRVKEII